MRKTTKKVVASTLACAMVASMAACGGSESGTQNTTTTPSSQEQTNNGEVKKPSSIRVVMNGTVLTEANGRAAFEEQLEAALGGDIDIIFDQQDHSGYADAVGRIFASGAYPDVILLSAEQYTSYASTGILWDMTEAYKNSEFQSRLTSNVNDNLKINGSLYGLAPTRGNGCVTYVKKAWLDAVGIEAPKTYAEYLNMIKLFTENDPDGDGVNDTYGVAAAGIYGTEAPYTNYLPEFYQKAYPDFLQDENGTWYDGFNTDDMKGALSRLQEAYQAKYIDPETLTMGTKDARNKFYADEFGVFTYWAGTWAGNLTDNLVAQGVDSELIFLDPIQEMGSYIERQAAVWSITTACENPEGVYKWFLETMLDGGDVQFLWTYGAKGTHWDTKAETFMCGEKEYSYEEGKFHMLPTPEKPDTMMKKNHLDNALVIAPMNRPTADVGTTTGIAAECDEFFIKNSKLAPFIPSSSVLNDYNGDIWDVKKKVITEVVVNNGNVDEWMQYYQKEAGSLAEEVLADLNK